MRISDWSSDVCSSDLRQAGHLVARHQPQVQGDRECDAEQYADAGNQQVLDLEVMQDVDLACAQRAAHADLAMALADPEAGQADDAGGGDRDQDQADHPHQDRSEEHTSELQSLMRISYAVLCMKKKNIKITL